jgi:hypothetical protein
MNISLVSAFNEDGDQLPNRGVPRDAAEMSLANFIDGLESIDGLVLAGQELLKPLISFLGPVSLKVRIKALKPVQQPRSLLRGKLFDCFLDLCKSTHAV